MPSLREFVIFALLGGAAFAAGHYYGGQAAAKLHQLLGWILAQIHPALGTVAGPTAVTPAPKDPATP